MVWNRAQRVGTRFLVWFKNDPNEYVDAFKPGEYRLTDAS